MTRLVVWSNFHLLLIAWTGCLHSLPGGVATASIPEICSLPAVTGPCKAYFRRYAFNATTQQCEDLVYGGCQGNANNFMTLAQCQTACTCYLPKTMGMWKFNGQWCRWSFPSYYDASSGTCSSFLYWGCGGNGNRFQSSQECNSACASSRCYGLKERRRCWSRNSKRRYSYDVSSGECQMVRYRGCNDRTENQFTSKKACNRLCKP